MPTGLQRLESYMSNGESRKYKHRLSEYRDMDSIGVRQLYKNISILFLFPVKDGKLSTGVNATFNASCYG